jgi:thiamine monophosphate synthase
MTRFIFMLTHNDVTVPDAIEVFEGVKDAGVPFVGFKDVGLPFEEMRALVNTIKGEGGIIFFEAVSLAEEGCIRSVDAAVKLGVDYFIGGTYLESALKQLRSKGIKYFPYVGRAVGHPCLLRGSIEEVVGGVRKAAASGVDGINLLAYRYNDDVGGLLTSVKSAVDIPLIVAGSIDSFERINRVVGLGVWGFTIGSAIFERKFSKDLSIAGQIKAIMAAIEEKEEK